MTKPTLEDQQVKASEVLKPLYYESRERARTPSLIERCVQLGAQHRCFLKKKTLIDSIIYVVSLYSTQARIEYAINVLI